MQRVRLIMTEIELIQLHGLIKDDGQACDSPHLNAHYAHMLLALQALIESHGPTSEYCEWSVQLVQTLFLTKPP